MIKIRTKDKNKIIGYLNDKDFDIDSNYIYGENDKRELVKYDRKVFYAEKTSSFLAFSNK